MKEYWLYTDEYPGDNNWEEWGIFEFEYYKDPEDDPDVDYAEITGIVINNTNLKIGNYDQMFDDSTTSNPKRILAFLFDRKFYV